MYDINDIVDNSYRVTGLCSDQGGMGVILHIEALDEVPDFPIVLKYCRETEDEPLKRFRREVRLLGTFKGNSKVVQIYDKNLEHDPPYFIMRFYPDGDLVAHVESIRESPEIQEDKILQMIECVQQLHARNEFHRDIKPQNFLVDGNSIIVSDFGLTTEIGSDTAFTRSSTYWGSHGYIPPEFLDGGFKHADASGDIFMIGKTIYALLTGRDPLYLVGDNISSPIFHVIERCCAITKEQRYQSLADLKQSVVAAYDVMLGRAGSFGQIKQLLSSINDRLEQKGKYRSEEILKFIELLSLLDESDQVQVCHEIPKRIYGVLGQAPVMRGLDSFLTVYEKLVEGRNYSWSYAETIALNMRKLFLSPDTSLPQKAKALELGICAAEYMERFAAMDTCKSLITSITDDELGLQVATVITNHRNGFAGEIEPSECNCDTIRNALRQIQTT